MKITYRPWFYDPDDCEAWIGPIKSRFEIRIPLLWGISFFIAATGAKADFLADQLYDLWEYSPDTSRAFK